MKSDQNSSQGMFGCTASALNMYLYNGEEMSVLNSLNVDCNNFLINTLNDIIVENKHTSQLFFLHSDFKVYNQLKVNSVSSNRKSKLPFIPAYVTDHPDICLWHANDLNLQIVDTRDCSFKVVSNFFRDDDGTCLSPVSVFLSIENSLIIAVAAAIDEFDYTKYYFVINDMKSDIKRCSLFKDLSNLCKLLLTKSCSSTALRSCACRGRAGGSSSEAQPSRNQARLRRRST